MIGGPPNVSAMITDQIDAAAVLVTIEGMNANSRSRARHVHRRATARARPTRWSSSSSAKVSRREPEGPQGRENHVGARSRQRDDGEGGARQATGSRKATTRIEQLDMGQHVEAMTAGTFDAGYTLEPNASMMRKQGVARTLETGVIAKYVLGDPERQCLRRRLRARPAIHHERPTWPGASPPPGRRRSQSSTKNPQEARKHLAKNTLTPEEVVDTVPMVGYFMVAELTASTRRNSRNSSTSRSRRHVRRRSTHRSIMQGVLRSRSDAGRGPRPWPQAGLSAGGSTPHVTVRGLRNRFGAATIYDGFDLDIPRGKLRLGVRAERLRQEHADQPDRRPHPDRRAERSASAASRSARSGSATSSRTTARRCFPGCARSTTSNIR